jgi:hypothetical protein
MTRDDVIRMAREAGYGWSMTDMHAPALERFAALVAAAERRECVIACEGVEQATESQSWVVANCVADILARDKI